MRSLLDFVKRKSGKIILAFCSAVVFLAACQEDERVEAEPDVDIRDLYVGSYLCEVTKKNFQTDVLLDSYTDTVHITKQGEDRMLIDNLQNIQLPEVNFFEAGARTPTYVAISTIVVFNESNVEITHGHDTAFYEIKGRKVVLE